MGCTHLSAALREQRRRKAYISVCRIIKLLIFWLLLELNFALFERARLQLGQLRACMLNGTSRGFLFGLSQDDG